MNIINIYQFFSDFIKKLILILIIEFIFKDFNKNQMQTKYFILFGLLFFGTFVWEHLSKKNDINIKPSTGLNYCATQIQFIWTKIGYYFAKISSFYTLIDLEDIIETIKDIISPSCKILMSPYHAIKEYFITMNLYSNPYLITFGSITLILLAIVLAFYLDLMKYFGILICFKTLFEYFLSAFVW